MEENVTLFMAFGAGLLSFISPCVLPLVPGYLSYISGLSLDEMRATPPLATMRVLQRGNRLSITPVTAAEWKAVLKLLG